MAQVLLTDAAHQARLEIWLHIAADNPTAARSVLQRFDDRCEIYANQPLLAEARPDLGRNVRAFAVGEYVVIYRPLANGIEVLLIVHGSRDIPALFRGKEFNKSRK